MNLILIVSDTLRRDHLGCHGNPWIRTPHLDALAAESVVFDCAYTGSFPTVPNRTDVMTGRFSFVERDWSPLRPEDVTLAQVLGEASYTTMMVADTPHILQQGYNFSRGFAGFDWIRGQENDHYRTCPRQVSYPCDKGKLRGPDYTMVHYLRNISARRREEDYFVAQTMRRAADWLEENAREGPFFLYVDTFDPHEPWDPPRWYVDLYDPGYQGQEVIYPRYDRWREFLTEAELKHCRALYAGEVTLVDRWVGHLLARIEELGLRDDTAVIVTTDHGFYHGEHGLIGKVLVKENGSLVMVPLWEEVARIPLFVRLPGKSPGRRTEAIVQPADLMPTLLQLAQVEIPGTVQGRSFLPLLTGGAATHREIAVSSPAIIYRGPSRRWSTITDGEWSLIYAGQREEAAEAAVTRVVDSIARRETAEFHEAQDAELYHLSSDQTQEKNVLAQHPGEARRLHAGYVRFLEETGAAPEILARRRELKC